jgi:formate hydrogenlyase subunit 3/multisubunit Na+/H+ antiporter MnhD subunit
MTLLLLGLGLILAGAMSTVVTRRSRRLADVLYQSLVVAGCAISAVAAARVLTTGAQTSIAIRSAMPGGDWQMGIDALSAVFLLAVLGVGAMCAVFGTHDLAREHEGQREAGEADRSTWFTQLAFGVLLAAIALVVVARSVVVFLGAWEVMAISSYVLIITHHEDADVRRSGLIYLVATHTATLALFAMFAVWQTPAVDWSFGALAAASPSLHAGARTAVLLLALLGFGFKAGAVPLHIWLPPAHAAAPSHVSALMSGIVIKTGIYGLLRVLLLLGGAPAWWGWLVLGIGVASGVLGVLWALAQHDMKRLLAYHSVENIGIILMGIGVGALGAANGAPAIAMLGFAGGLLHTINHALFKSLLFLGAGAVYRATGTRNMEELGGLARRMPLTWLGFVVGATAIIGVPPLNGFVSEWLVYQGLFATGQSAEPMRLALLGIPALALVGALALACFAKVAGVVFLGTPRTAHAREAAEGGRGATLPMLILAAACIVLGVGPAFGISLVSATARELSGMDAAIPSAVVSSAWALSLLALATLALSAALWWIRHALTGRGRQIVRRDVTWACGYDAVTPRMQYTASSFASPLLSVFGRLSGVRVERSAASLHTQPADLVLDGLALPLWHTLHGAALRLRAIQQGRLHLYLLYVLAALLVLLAYLALG